MRRIILALLLIALGGCDQRDEVKKTEPATSGRPIETVTVAPAPRPEPAFERAFLWRVTGPDAEHESFLFGTIHGGVDVTWETLPRSVRDAIQASDLVVLEAKIEGASASKVAGRMMLPDGQSLKQALGEERFRRLAEVTEYPPSALDRMRPWLVHSTIVQKWLGRGKPLDVRISTFAQARDKEVVYIETIDEQLATLDEAIDFDVLAAVADDLEGQRDSLHAMVGAYREGDEEALVESLFDPAEMKNHPQLFVKLFDERNEAWVGELEQKMRSKPSFVAVGVGHLVGERSVVDLLRERGWKIERVE